MRFESEKPSPNSNSGIEVLLEMQAGTDRKRLVARVKELRRTPLAGFNGLKPHALRIRKALTEFE